MGCDIHGYIEVKKYDWYPGWDVCLDIGSIVGRNYDMFALLFGVRNRASYIPLAERRGLPADISEEAKKDYDEWESDAHSPSWITWGEIETIKWTEKGTQLADRVYCYRKGEDQWFQAFGWSSELSDADYATLNRGESIERNDIIYKRNVISKQDAMSGDWKCIFDIMKRINEHFTACSEESNVIESTAVPAVYQDNSRVRLVVWFDN